MPEFKGFAKNEQGEPVLVAYFPHARTFQPTLNADGSITINAIATPHEKGLTKSNIEWELRKLQTFNGTDAKAVEANNLSLATYGHFQHLLKMYTASVNPPVPQNVPRVQPEEVEPAAKSAVA